MLSIGVIGVSFKTASLELREKLARYTELQGRLSFNFPHIILATCNRFEIYFDSPDLLRVAYQLIADIQDEIGGLGASSFYMFERGAAFTHLARVISGLDSAIIAESDVKRQVKNAYQEAAKVQQLSKSLHYVFQKSLRVGKMLRTNFLSRVRSPSLESFILSEMRDAIFQPVLFIGYSDINRKLIRELIHRGARNIALCTRFSCDSLDFDTFDFQSVGRWIDYPTVIVGTKYPDYLLKEEHTYAKKTCTQQIFDLGIPRNVDPQIRVGRTLSLYDLEGVAHACEQERKLSRELKGACESEIESMIERYQEIFALREVYKGGVVAHT